MTRLFMPCVLAFAVGCTGGVDRTEPARVGAAAAAATSGRSSMESRGDGIVHIEQGRIPQRALVDARRLLEGRALPEVAPCPQARCVDAWEDRGRGVIALRVRSGELPAESPEHVTLLWGGADASANARSALRDAVRDAPSGQRFSLVEATRPPRVWARSGGDATSRASVIEAFDAMTSPQVDVHAGLAAAFEESARSGAGRRRVLVLIGGDGWPDAATPTRSGELVRVEREGVVEVGALSEGVRVDSAAVRDIAGAGGGPRGHLTGRGDAWARAGVRDGLVDAGEVTLELTLPDGVRAERVWGGRAVELDGGVRIELGRLVGYSGEELFDSLVLIRVSRGEGAAEGAGVVFEGADVALAPAELGDMGDAATALESIEGALGAFEAGGPERARGIARSGAREVTPRGRDARLLDALADGLEDFIGR